MLLSQVTKLNKDKDLYMCNIHQYSGMLSSDAEFEGFYLK